MQETTIIHTLSKLGIIGYFKRFQKKPLLQLQTKAPFGKNK